MRPDMGDDERARRDQAHHLHGLGTHGSHPQQAFDFDQPTLFEVVARAAHVHALERLFDLGAGERAAPEQQIEQGCGGRGEIGGDGGDLCREAQVDARAQSRREHRLDALVQRREGLPRHPAGQIEQFVAEGRFGVEHALDGARLRDGGCVRQGHHHAGQHALAQRHGDQHARPDHGGHLRRDAVIQVGRGLGLERQKNEDASVHCGSTPPISARLIKLVNAAARYTLLDLVWYLRLR